MLSHAIGGLLPAALAVALSPIPIVAVTLMLGTPRARTNGVGFASGWIVGLVAVSVVVLLVTHGSSTANSNASGGVRWGTLAVGVLFLSMAFRQLRKRPKKGETPEMPSWMATIDHFTAVKSTVLGVALSAANPKNLLLTATAAAAIAQQGLTSTGDVVAVAVFVVIASSTVGGPVLLYLLAPKKMSGPLDTVREFMSEHNAVIMFVVLLLLGVKLIGNGIAG
jgi:threonine/homoserine/homoserine lactone efflux protein